MKKKTKKRLLQGRRTEPRPQTLLKAFTETTKKTDLCITLTIKAVYPNENRHQLSHVFFFFCKTKISNL